MKKVFSKQYYRESHDKIPVLTKIAIGLAGCGIVQLIIIHSTH